VEGKEIDEKYDQLQKEIDKMRYQVYEKHDPIRKVCNLPNP